MLRLATNYLVHAARERLGRPTPYRPLFAVLYVTWRCNLACTYCDDGTGRKYPDRPVGPADPELATDGMKRLLGRIRPFADVLNLCGGEPLVRRDLEDLAEESKRLGFRTLLLSTNGVGLEKRTRLLGKVDYFLVSLDTLDERAGAALWGGAPGTVRRVMDTIEWVAGLRRRYGHQVVVNGVITPDNVDDIHAVIDWCLARGIYFSASPQMLGRFPVEALRDHAGYRALVDRLIRLRSEGKRIVGTTAFLRLVRDFTAPYDCRPQTLVNVRPDGRVYYPCNIFDRPAGSLLEHATLEGAIDEGIARNGRLERCDGYCPTLRYMNGTLQIHDPTIVLEELGVVTKRALVEAAGAARRWLA